MKLNSWGNDLQTFCGTHVLTFTGKGDTPTKRYTCVHFKIYILDMHIYIYVPGSRFATTPPPHGMVPKPAFCSIPHENVVFAVFFAWWVAGAVRKPANSLDFCNQPSENVLFAMFWLRHRGVVQPRPLLFLCQLVI